MVKLQADQPGQAPKASRDVCQFVVVQLQLLEPAALGYSIPKL